LGDFGLSDLKIDAQGALEGWDLGPWVRERPGTWVRGRLLGGGPRAFAARRVTRTTKKTCLPCVFNKASDKQFFYTFVKFIKIIKFL
jgi:hypothetical protein